MVLVCVPLAAPIGLSPPLIPTLCGPERVLVVSTEPPDDFVLLDYSGGRPSRRWGCAIEGGAVEGGEGYPPPPPPTVYGHSDTPPGDSAWNAAAGG